MFSVIRTGAVYVILILSVVSVYADEQSVNLPDRTCSGEYSVKQFQGKGKLVLRFSKEAAGTISGQVVSSENSPLPYPHDFTGTELGELKTDHGVMRLKVISRTEENRLITVAGTARVYKNDKYKQQEIDVDINLVCVASPNV